MEVLFFEKVVIGMAMLGMMPGRCVFVIGVPGAGKDMNGDALFQMDTEHHRMLSMSGLIEYALEMGTIEGYSRAHKNNGVLLEDAQTNKVLKGGLDNLDDGHFVIVTGFPRTENQAQFAIEYCFERGWAVTFLILYVTEEVSMERVRQRREKDLKEKGSTRPDDEEAVARARYRLQSGLLRAMEPGLRRLPADVLPVDGSDRPEKVFDMIITMLRATQCSLAIR